MVTWACEHYRQHAQEIIVASMDAINFTQQQILSYSTDLERSLTPATTTRYPRRLKHVISSGPAQLPLQKIPGKRPSPGGQLRSLVGLWSRSHPCRSAGRLPPWRLPSGRRNWACHIFSACYRLVLGTCPGLVITIFSTRWFAAV